NVDSDVDSSSSEGGVDDDRDFNDDDESDEDGERIKKDSEGPGLVKELGPSPAAFVNLAVPDFQFGHAGASHHSPK
ncbi:hypothetical protein LTR28_007161, partial [Elasticomyces elasticus]